MESLCYLESGRWLLGTPVSPFLSFLSSPLSPALSLYLTPSLSRKLSVLHCSSH